MDNNASPGAVPIIGKISFGGIISLAAPDDAASYRGKLFLAESGDFIYSKIRAKQGSFALVPAHIQRLAVSSEYPVFSPDENRILPAYLPLLLRCPVFLQILDGVSSGGSTKTRIAPNQFEGLRVAVPPLPTQRAIVAHWEAAQEKCADLLKAAYDEEKAMSREFLLALGLDQKPGLATGRSFALRWSEIARWGVNQAKRLQDAPNPNSGKYPVVSLRELIADLQNGWSPKCFSRPASGDEWGVLKLGSVSYGEFNPAANKALPPSLSPSSAYEVKAGDVLFVRGNVLELVGTAAYVQHTPPRLMMPDLIFRAVFRRETKIDPRYLAEIMKTPHVRQQIEAVATGTSPSMKKISKPGLFAIQIPLPPLAIQQQLVETITTARAGISEKRAAAAELKVKTAREIEEMILGHRPV